MKICRIVPSLVISVFLIHGSIAAQSTSFTYQGELQLSSQPANGTFDFEFLLYDASSGGTQIGATATRSNITVTDGRFTVSLDFGANFTGPERFLEIRVRQTGGGGFTILDPRQRIGSSPYAVRSVSAAAADTATTATNATNAVNATNAANATNATNATTAATAANALNLGGVAANQYVVTTDPRLSDARTPTPGSASYIQNTTTDQSNANFSITGDGRARNLNAVGSFQFNGLRAFWAPGTDNLFAGIGSGLNGTTGTNNAFFGRLAGSSITTGENNSFFGSRAGLSNNSGSNHSFFGNLAGRDSGVGSDGNTFVGWSAGLQTTNGSGNTFIGRGSGTTNTIGSGNTLIGAGTSVAANGLIYATAIGADSVVTESETIVLGRPLGQDKVVIPGELEASFPITSTTINATTQFNIGGSRILGASVKESLYLGFTAGSNDMGDKNSFVGYGAGTANLFGRRNAFFGFASGASNQSGDENVFIGNEAGSGNTSGTGNTFIGSFAGTQNQTGNSNTTIGQDANVIGPNLSFATAIGAQSGVTTSNTIALGRGSGQDTVRIPGNLAVIGSLNIAALSAATVNAGTQFNLNGSRVLHLSGANSTFVGNQAGGSTAGSGSSNSAFGHLSGASIGSNTFSNSFFGHLSGQNTNGGSSNAFYGADAGRANVGGNDNTFLGRSSGVANSAGSSNTFVGRTSGSSNVSGSNNTTLGSSADIGSSNLSFATAIGASSLVTTSNTIALGRSNGSDTVRVYGRLRLGLFGAPSAVPLCIDGGSSEITTCSSSLRYKENVFDYTSGLSLIRRLRPVYFDWKHNGVRDFGLVAEEVAAVEPLLATTNKDGEIQGVNYERVGVVLVNAVNEQQAEIDRLKADSENKSRQIDTLLEANRRQQAQIEALTKLFCSANPAAGICRDKP